MLWHPEEPRPETQVSRVQRIFLLDLHLKHSKLEFASVTGSGFSKLPPLI
jgi:hypothetical protein